MSYYFLGDKLEEEDIEEIRECCKSIRDKLRNTVNWFVGLFC